jgi:Cys-rich protein (TIGR01571 family)
MSGGTESVQLQLPQRSFSSNLFECSRDEESCWWSFWCCWIVEARTAASLELGSSKVIVSRFWCVLVSSILLFVFGFGNLALLVGVGGGIYIYVQRSNLRGQIRHKYNISGSVGDDFLTHFFCPLCAICQESREAKNVGGKHVDFCSGQDLLLNEQAHNDVTGATGGTSINDSYHNDDYGSFMSHVKVLSETSKIILWLSLGVILLCSVLLVAIGKGANVVVLLLVFVQPFLILYFVYWKYKRQYALLDMVIKCFAVGFWFTTLQSIVLEVILQAVLYLLLGIVEQVVDPSTSSSDGDSSSSSSTSTLSIIQIFSGILSLVTSKDSSYMVNAAAATDDDAANREELKGKIIFVVIGIFLESFIVAAGVEETMKHFIVRYCQFPTLLRNPHAILVYLMAGALGFATSENVEYVFGTTSSPIPGANQIEGELFVLLLRVLLPVHVICSVIQAANLSKVLCGGEQMHLFFILLPAIILHGTFDFVLFMFSTFAYIYDKDSIQLDIISMVVAAIIAICGACYAYWSFNKVVSTDLFSRVNSVGDDNVNEMHTVI